MPLMLVCVRGQARYQAAEMRARQTQETLTQQEAEAVKLEQRLAAAREQYDSGLSKLRSTARELERLSAQVGTAVAQSLYVHSLCVTAAMASQRMLSPAALLLVPSAAASACSVAHRHS